MYDSSDNIHIPVCRWTISSNWPCRSWSGCWGTRDSVVTATAQWPPPRWHPGWTCAPCHPPRVPQTRPHPLPLCPQSGTSLDWSDQAWWRWQTSAAQSWSQNRHMWSSAATTQGSCGSWLKGRGNYVIIYVTWEKIKLKLYSIKRGTRPLNTWINFALFHRRLW